jgi:hypothetical protein
MQQRCADTHFYAGGIKIASGQATIDVGGSNFVVICGRRTARSGQVHVRELRTGDSLSWRSQLVVFDAAANKGRRGRAGLASISAALAAEHPTDWLALASNLSRDGADLRIVQGEAQQLSCAASDQPTRLAALTFVTGQTALAEITTTSRDTAVQRAAMVRLTDLRELTRIVKDVSVDLSWRNLAVQQMTDEMELANIARHAFESSTRLTALERVRDQRVLALVAESDSSITVCRAALVRLVDQGVLARIAQSTRPWEIRIVTLDLLSDQRVLAQIAEFDGSASMRRCAIDHLDDQATLERIARTHQDNWSRTAAIGRIFDQGVLIDIAESTAPQCVRVVAIEHCTDQSLLTRIAQSSEQDSLLRVAAIGRVKGRTVLSHLATHDASDWVRRAAAEALSASADQRLSPEGRVLA